MVCKLKKSIYGLKQASRQWYHKFHQVIISYGFEVNVVDDCVYHKFSGSKYIFLVLYVDDLLIMGSSHDTIMETKRMLKRNFDMKDMGTADVILGIKISRTPNGIILSQSHYVEKVLKKFNAFDNSPSKTPIDLSINLVANKTEPVAQMEYSRIIGSLMYITNCTRPDLAYPVNMLSRFTSNPSHEHWKALTRVLKYLKYTLDYGLYYSRYPVVLEGYSDASWISDSKDSYSTSGYIFTIGGGAVSWKSTKQTCIARSTMEFEVYSFG
ncbi:hypothetical protein DH2020_018978 [Rehmannia glutinosa]|uniref:Reverse transcriptase Ty1/copia-type domain-containing protein n=1 Tax=Rehmannia glutinosa TaxID=99300 RepID=A0ABR0WN86_REHGL